MSIIYGERVRLRAVERSDVSHFYDWVNDPEVTYGMALYLPMSTVDEQAWFERVTQRVQEEKPLAIEVRQDDGWRLIGNCGVFAVDWVNRLAELGIMIGEKPDWNKGYGTEVMRVLLRHCFETLNLNRVFLRVYADNTRARRAYERAGFVEEGALRQARFKRGQYVDVVLMSVLRSEWTASPKER